MLIWVDPITNIVTGRHYMPELLSEEQKAGSMQVDSLPDEPAPQVGKVNVLYYENGAFVWKTDSRPLFPEEKVQQLQEEKDALEQKLAQLNGDFAAFTDFYFTKFPEQA